MKNKYKIGLDIDSVLLDTMDEFLKLMNNDLKTNFTRKNITCYNFNTKLGISRNEMVSYFKKINYNNIDLMDENIPTILNEWKNKGYKIDLITNTVGNINVIVNKLYELGINYNVLYHLKGSKKELSSTYDVFVDDSVKHLEECLSLKGNPICFDQPWNQEWDGARVFNFKQLEKIIEEGY